MRNETTVGNSKRERVLLYSKYSKCMNKQSIFGAIDWGLLSVFCLNSEIKYIQIGFECFYTTAVFLLSWKFLSYFCKFSFLSEMGIGSYCAFVARQ